MKFKYSISYDTKTFTIKGPLEGAGEKSGWKSYSSPFLEGEGPDMGHKKTLETLLERAQKELGLNPEQIEYERRVRH
ncbi:MAG TPA: hypothetical protein VI968_03105 [archaeon]|nr:hypothetical protein [archaeon]